MPPAKPVQHKFFSFLPETPNVDFMRHRATLFTVSGVLSVLGLAVILLGGIRWGIDFRGGSEIIVRFNQPQPIDAVRKAVGTAKELHASVVSFQSDPHTFIVKTPAITSTTPEKIEKLKADLSGALQAYAFDPATFHESEGGGDKIEFIVRDPLESAAPAPQAMPGAPTREELSNLPPQIQDEILAGTTAPAVPAAPSTYGTLPVDEVSKRIREIFAAAGVAAYDVHFERTTEPHQHLVRVILEGVYQPIHEALERAFGKDSHSLAGLSTVGPKVGEKLRNDAILALTYALIGIFIYIMFRFELKFAPGAVICLFHDVMITIGIYSLAGYEFSMGTVASLLTLVGYSINDTIIVYDRIRENNGMLKHKTIEEVVNISCNQTLGRTIITSSLTALSLVAIWLFGGGEIEAFAFALIVGIAVGTYSSIYIAAPLMIYVHHYQAKVQARLEAAERGRRPSRTSLAKG